MKLLEKGSGWNLEMICTGKGNGECGCGAKLLVEKDDIYLTHSYDYGGGHDIYYTFRCMECGEETDIPGNLIPNGIRRKLLEEYRDTIDKGRNK